MDAKRASVSEAYASRLEAAKERRHSSTVGALQKAMDDKVNVVQVEELSDEDKKLAEMGYVQVRSDVYIYPPIPRTHRYI